MWAKLDDALIDHRKISAAGAFLGKNGDGRAIALGFFAIALMWSNKHLSDGVIPEAVVRSWSHVKKPLAVAEALVQAGLFERTGDGFRIHDFHDFNPTAQKVKADREWDRRRKELYADSELTQEVRLRDQNRCRYCGQLVNWKDRRGPIGGQFDHVIPRGPNNLENIVVACRGCNYKKQDRTPEEAAMKLLPPGSMG
jgi:hypothetical protein